MGAQYGHPQQVVQDIANISDHSGEREMTSHGKEKPSRITSDAEYRDNIRKCLTCIAPLDPYSHPADVVSVVIGLISPEMVNAHDAVHIGRGQLVSLKRLAFHPLTYPSCF